MTAEIILANSFYAFFYVLGEHFQGILAMGLLHALLLAFYYLLFKR